MSDAGTWPKGQHATRAMLDVIRERFRQVAEEGWTAEHDDGHARGEMALAAAAYATSAAVASQFLADGIITAADIDSVTATCPAPSTFPWDRKQWKPKNRRRDLVRAGALIIAEIERVDRVDVLVNVFDDSDEYIAKSVPLREVLGDDDAEYDDIRLRVENDEIANFGGGAAPFVHIELAGRRTT